MKALLEKIGLNAKLKALAINEFKKSENKITRLADKCYTQGFNILIKENDLIKLCVCIYYASKYTKEKYKELGINDEIFYATMSDIGIWCSNNNNKGLKNVSWIANHLKCELFRIGRLQYQLYPCKSKTLKYELLPFEYGENTIYIHIPQGEKLVYADCINSIKNAKAFFKKYFESYHYSYFFCESWLLFEDNWIFMAPNCNILQFATIFDIGYSLPKDNQAIERIYGKRHFIKKHYPENTSLQRWAKAFMLDGGRLGVGIGTIHIDEI